MNPEISEAVALKPCPFCGDMPERVEGHDSVIAHPSNDCLVPVRFFDTEKWNRRALTSQPRAPINSVVGAFSADELAKELGPHSLCIDARTWGIAEKAIHSVRCLERAVQPSAPGEAVAGGIVAEIFAELTRATAKFPTWPTDPLHALGVVTEEYGELGKEVLQLVYEPHKSSKDEVRKEAIQTAAMALRFAMSLDQYEYKKGVQHEQGT